MGRAGHRWKLDRGLVSECLQAVDLRDFMVSEIPEHLPTCGCDSGRVPRAVEVAAKVAEVRVACSAFNTALHVFLR